MKAIALWVLIGASALLLSGCPTYGPYMNGHGYGGHMGGSHMSGYPMNGY